MKRIVKRYLAQIAQRRGAVRAVRAASTTAGAPAVDKAMGATADANAPAVDSAAPAVFSTLLLSRLPIITPDPSPFEAQFYSYQSELLKRLMWTFPKWFYYKKGTLGEIRYTQINKPPVSNDRSIIYPRGRPQLRHLRDLRFKQEIRLPKTYREEDQMMGQSEENVKEKDMSRKIIPNKRDQEGRGLERKLQRTLYMVRKEDGKWRFPRYQVGGAAGEGGGGASSSSLHSVIHHHLSSVNHFIVSPQPCHHLTHPYGKEYFIKAHILSGELKGEYQWLTKEELREVLGKEYEGVKHLLST
ncbi:hypothetical protein KGF56_003947 [Candida oxycetoniae]|uniref:Large ribosomal subunit protein mL46 N-terminal domain-containing protein n=1 Tax=Candida oxycetoniae TaxID=497107 RepID=A0AAI9SVA7_9ASCO|nr:uncharacterized protein KGF56_003947 [Candida oxycetoniae]KAI3403359.2 hypothetical protein KGF56_003947 [Candida oxycetoniae]